MFCESCGSKQDDSAQFCENCGASLAPATAPARTIMPEPTPEYSSPSGGTYATIGIVVGVIGLFTFYLFIFGPIAIVLGYIGRSKGAQTLGLVAIVLGAISLILSFLMLVVFL